MDINDESEPEGPDPVEASIKERVDIALAEFTIEADGSRLEPHLRTLMSSQETRLVVVLDAPTSRAKIVTAMIDKVGELIQSNPPEGGTFVGSGRGQILRPAGFAIAD